MIFVCDLTTQNSDVKWCFQNIFQRFQCPVAINSFTKPLLNLQAYSSHTHNRFDALEKVEIFFSFFRGVCSISCIKSNLFELSFWSKERQFHVHVVLLIIFSTTLTQLKNIKVWKTDTWSLEWLLAIFFRLRWFSSAYERVIYAIKLSSSSDVSRISLSFMELLI